MHLLPSHSFVGIFGIIEIHHCISFIFNEKKNFFLCVGWLDGVVVVFFSFSWSK